tara:strand:- start:94478 stop:95041 length:564 start_codon:yes stop_codon:yes gene_type:complete
MIRKIRRKARLTLNSIVYKIRFFGKGIKIHPSSYVSRKAAIRNTGAGVITIGADCEIHPYSMILSYGGEIIIGDNCSLNSFSIIYGQGGVKIGSGVRIACQSVIIPANHVISDTNEPLYKSGLDCRGILIEDNVWVASGCRILDGVNVGRGSILAAGSVVNKSVESGSIVGGVPAKHIKYIKKHNSF